MSLSELYNALPITPHLLSAGQPTADQLRSLAAAGYRTVINLATPASENHLPEEAALLADLGLRYVPIPVLWNAPQGADFAQFEQVMLSLPPGPVLLHCAANFRATAFYALFAERHLGWTQAQGEAFRAQIWQGYDDPVWERFLAEIRGPAGAGADHVQGDAAADD